MSYILDALHKSEQQRNGLPEALAEEYRAPEPITEYRRTRWLITAVILFAVFAAISLYFWLSPRQPSMVVKTAAPQTAVVIDNTIAATPPSTPTPTASTPPTLPQLVASSAASHRVDSCRQHHGYATALMSACLAVSALSVCLAVSPLWCCQ